MLTNQFALQFARDWINAWNSHDLENVLSHYSEDFTIESPLAAVLVPESDGVVSGKPAVRAYWQAGLAKAPRLRFELIDVLVGVDGLTVYYLNTATNRKSTETMRFDQTGRVNKAVVHYSV